MNYKRIIIIVSFLVVGTLIGIWRHNMKEIEIQSISYDNEAIFYSNPTNISNIGDPFVLKVEDTYYCYPTSSPSGYLVYRSKDLVHWEEIGQAYTSTSKGWANQDFWAPEVVAYQGKYYMYYTARWKEQQSLRIGVAVSDTPTGPFVDVLTEPMFDYGYAVIDAHVFIDTDNNKYLYFSRDCSENIVVNRHESHIYGVRLSEDMVSVIGQPQLLTKPDQPWELNSGDYVWNEGAFVLKHEGLYYLMYSSNYYASRDYSIGYATSLNPLGPFKKYENNPVLATKDSWKDISGPGHHSLVYSPDDSELWVVYHTHTVAQIGGGNRQVAIDRMGFLEDGTLYINGPTLGPQLLPSGAGLFKNIAQESSITYNGKAIDFLNNGDYSLSDVKKSIHIQESDKINIQWDKPQKVVGIRVYIEDKQISTSSFIKANLLNNKYVKLNKQELKIGGALEIYFDEIQTDAIDISFNIEDADQLNILELQIISSSGQSLVSSN